MESAALAVSARDRARLDEIGDVLLERLGAQLLAAVGHELAELAHAARVLEALAHGRRRDQHLDGRHAALLVLLGKELLQTIARSASRQSHPADLPLLPRQGREDPLDAW